MAGRKTILIGLAIALSGCGDKPTPAKEPPAPADAPPEVAGSPEDAAREYGKKARR